MKDDDVPLSSEPDEPDEGRTRLPRAGDLPPRVYLRGDGGWSWLDEHGDEIPGPHIDGASGIDLRVSLREGEKRMTARVVIKREDGTIAFDGYRPVNGDVVDLTGCYPAGEVGKFTMGIDLSAHDPAHGGPNAAE